MINRQGGEEGKGGGMNPATNRHLVLEIKTLLQNAPIDAGKVGKAFESKRGKTKRRRLCTHRRYTKRLVV
jgi:hypothetical protein